jgi:hypothetical protein
MEGACSSVTYVGNELHGVISQKIELLTFEDDFV